MLVRPNLRGEIAVVRIRDEDVVCCEHGVKREPC
jgi:hypothetical protein